MERTRPRGAGLLRAHGFLLVLPLLAYAAAALAAAASDCRLRGRSKARESRLGLPLLARSPLIRAHVALTMPALMLMFMPALRLWHSRSVVLSHTLALSEGFCLRGEHGGAAALGRASARGGARATGLPLLLLVFFFLADMYW